MASVAGRSPIAAAVWHIDFCPAEVCPFGAFRHIAAETYSYGLHVAGRSVTWLLIEHDPVSRGVRSSGFQESVGVQAPSRSRHRAISIQNVELGLVGANSQLVCSYVGSPIISLELANGRSASIRNQKYS
jgi:hypothetical protein